MAEERFAISEPTVEKITDAMYAVVNEGGTGGSLKLAGIELSGKSGTAQVIGYATRERLGKQKKFEDNAWFVGYAPRRNPEIVVSVSGPGKRPARWNRVRTCRARRHQSVLR